MSDKKPSNPLSELFDLGKALLAELPKAIEEIKEQGLGALEAGEAEPGSLPAEIRVRFRPNEAGELVPCLDGEKGAAKVGTYRLVGEAALAPEEPETEGKPGDTERPPA